MDLSIVPNIESIKIVLNTNIPGKESMPFTSSMVYHPSVKEMPKMSEYPFITIDRDYRNGISSYLNRLTYDKKVKFFFNKDSHLSGLSRAGLYTPNKESTKKSEPSENSINKKINKKEIDDEINHLIRNIIDKKKEALINLEKTYKSNIKELEANISREKTKYNTLETVNERDARFIRIENFEAELKDKNEEYKKRNEIIINKYKYQIKFVKFNLIEITDDKYKLPPPPPVSAPATDSTNPEQLKLITEYNKFLAENNNNNNNDLLTPDEYPPLYTTPDNKVKHQELKYLDVSKIGVSTTNTPNPSFPFANENIMILLQTLFPNCFPVLNNITDSFKMAILQESLPFTFKNAIPSILRGNAYESQYYSYLKISGTIYTTTQVIWLNDVYNHPAYSGLLGKNKMFYVLKNASKDKMKIDKTKKETKFKSDFSDKGKFVIDQQLIDFFNKQKKTESETPVYGENKTRELNEIIDTIIQDIENLIEFLSFSTPKYKLILDVTNSIRQRYKIIEDRIVKTKDIETKLNRLIKSIGELNTIEVIYSKYLDNKEIVLDYETEDETVKAELKSKYGFYITFVDSLKEFIRPARESTNPELQEILEDFSSGTKNDNFEFLMKPKTLLESEKSKKIIANTGISMIPITGNDPRLEVHVQIDCIEGELNDENKSKINCIYKGAYLGNMLDELLYPQKTSWELEKKRMFFNINDKEVQKEIKEKEAVLPKPPTEENKGKKNEPAPPPPLQAQGGGKTKKYRLLPIYKLRSNRRTRRR